MRPLILALLALSAAPAAAQEIPEPHVLGTHAFMLRPGSVFDPLEVQQRRAIICPVPASVASRFRSGSQIGRVAAVHRWVNHEITLDDRNAWRTADQTLELRHGGGADRALVKMQLLRALGFPRERLMLTIALDGAAFLTVYLDGRFVMLPSTSDEILSSAGRNRSVPHYSFSPQSGLDCNLRGSRQLEDLRVTVWVHGLRIAPSAIAASAQSGTTSQ